MIAKMKKLIILCLEKDRDATLSTLQDLGVVHVAPFTQPGGEDLNEARARHEEARQALDILRSRKTTDIAAAGGAPLTGAAAVANTLALFTRWEELNDERQHLVATIQHYEPLGNFEPEHIRALNRRGVDVKLFRTSTRDPLECDADAQRIVLGEAGGATYEAVVRQGTLTCKGGLELALPAHSLADARKALSTLDQDIATTERELATLAAAPAVVEDHLAEIDEQTQFLEARSGMGKAERISYLQGYSPADRVSGVEAAAQAQGWGVIVEDPKESDVVPTLIRNPRWVRPIKAVFDVIGILPGYREVDISAIFLIFFTIFFAMLIGDAGYGLLFLILTRVARFKLPHAPAYPFSLMTLLSLCTIVWGLLTGNIFGIPALPALLSGLKIGWLGSENNMMKLCFLIGSIHLTVAHVWNVLRVLNSFKAIAQLGWISVTWCMYALACNMILNDPLPGWFKPALTVGFLAILLFMNSRAEMKKEAHTYFVLPLDIIGNFVDVVSYVRLFAVGMASLAIAVNFNEMALAGGISGPVSALIMALILLLGHGLNILLCIMGVLVHGVRLNTLEFSRHMGMQWSGFVFKPLRRKVAATGETP